MRAEEVRERWPDFDTREVDRWIGVPLGGAHMKDDVHVNDIRRWVQGMQNPNPLHYDDEWAAGSRYGRILAPQSFAVCTDDSHGAAPAIQGNIPGTHMIFGGDEWWFFGPRVAPGDRLRQDRMLFDYKVAETKFAGPTMFSRGDTTYIDQRGRVICKQRSTSVRYRADDAVQRGLFMNDREPSWSDEQLADIEKQKFEYYQSVHDLGHDRRLFVKEGDRLSRRPIGPHTLMSFTTEWRSYLMTVWGAFRQTGGPSSLWNAGWLPEMDRDHEAARIDPAMADGLYKGPSRGHVQERYAQLIGMPRGYGYGASMGAWILDYLASWAGEWGEIVHSDMQYRSPAFTGDVTFLDGEVVELRHDDPSGQPQARVRVTMTNQREEVMAQGHADLSLPTETLPAPAAG
ncbi:MAG: MaoC family dehydratase N-terminal domain-containing protein [Myxococcota bacterium]